MMQTKGIIISAFPGTGKSTAFNHQNEYGGIDILDSDSSMFSWIIEDGKRTNIRNPNFPDNYITHIKNSLGKADIIFVSSHYSVRKELTELNIPFITVYPDRNCKDEYLERYKQRGSSQAFIENMSDMWDIFIDEAKDIKYMGTFRRTLHTNEYIDQERILNIMAQVGTIRAAERVCREPISI